MNFSKDHQYRPRLTSEEMELINSYRAGDVMYNTNKVKLDNNPAKILIFDIETAPLKAYVWGIWQQNVNTQQIINEWYMLSWAGKWLFEEEVFGDVLTPEESIEQNDKRITRSIWEMLDEADIIVGHNIDKFDVKKLNTRFAYHGYAPPMPYKTVDTLKAARSQFSFSSNKLDYLNKMFQIDRKMDTGGFKLWEGCMEGDQESLDKMFKYNKQDIKASEDLYLRILPWIKSHPNMGLYVEDDVECCPNCGSEVLEFDTSNFYTNVSVYEAFRCNHCEAVGRSRKSDPSKTNLVVGIRK